MGLAPDNFCVAACTGIGVAIGGAAGQIGGGILGGAAGGVIGTAGGPAGTALGGGAGAAWGSAMGGAAGAAAGGALGNAAGQALCPDKNDFCHKRWEQENQRCDQWSGLGKRAVRACKTRASDRRSLCISNGGTPNVDEPPEYNPFVDYPR
jgi:hypothetical protein